LSTSEKNPLPRSYGLKRASASEGKKKGNIVAVANNLRLQCPFTMGEDLAAQAERGIALARIHCSSCAGYHEDWYRRRSEVDRESQLLVNPDFMAGLFHAIARNHAEGRERLRFFIAGSADTKLLAACAHAASLQSFYPPETVSYHVMDACLTPLLLCQDFAARHSLQLSVTHGLLPQDLPRTTADVAIVSGVLRFIPPDAHAAVVTGLSRLCTGGGRLVFTQSLRPPGGGEPGRHETQDPDVLRRLLMSGGFAIEREAIAIQTFTSGTEDRRKRTRFVATAKSISVE